jgi:hypothetical protein
MGTGARSVISGSGPPSFASTGTPKAEQDWEGDSMRRFLAVMAAIGFLHAAVVVMAAETLTAAEKLPAPPRTPETGVDPGIQVHPGPSPDPQSAIPPKHNPDPEMAIHPDDARKDLKNTRPLPPLAPRPDRGETPQPKKGPNFPKP